MLGLDRDSLTCEKKKTIDCDSDRTWIARLLKTQTRGMLVNPKGRRRANVEAALHRPSSE